MTLPDFVATKEKDSLEMELEMEMEKRSKAALETTETAPEEEEEKEPEPTDEDIIRDLRLVKVGFWLGRTKVAREYNERNKRIRYMC